MRLLGKVGGAILGLNILLLVSLVIGNAIVVPADEYVEAKTEELHVEKVGRVQGDDSTLWHAVIFVEVLLEEKYSADGLIFTLSATKRDESVYRVKGQVEYNDAQDVLTDDIDALVSTDGNLWVLQMLEIDGRRIE